MASLSSNSLSSAPNQMQVRVTFYTTHDPQSVLMILKNDCALEQISEKARELFPAADYRLFYGDVNGPIQEFSDSDQVMSKVRISTFSRTPQLFVRMEPRSSYVSSKKSKESKSSSSLKRIEQNQEQTLKAIAKLTKEFDRVSNLEKIVADMQNKEEPKKKRIQQSKHSATCDACLGDVVGHRYKCLECADFDLCEKCEKNSVHYEHAMIRLVCPRKTHIPEYITSNAPNSVFPSYMRSNDIIVDIPIGIPIRTPAASTAGNTANPPQPARDYTEETRAALIASAAVIKNAVQNMSKGFLDLAEGAQTGMDRKYFERPKADAEVDKIKGKIDVLQRRIEETFLASQEQEQTEAPSEQPAKIYPNLNTENYIASTPADSKYRKCKKRFGYRKAAEKLSTTSVLAAMAKEETEKRIESSTAELQRKLAELNTKEVIEKTENQAPVRIVDEIFDAYMKIYSSMQNATPVTTPEAATPTAPEAQEPQEPDTPVLMPTAPIVETVTPVSTPLTTSQYMDALVTLPVVPKMVETIEVAQVVNSSSPSIHSSFENIASDFESIDSNWEVEQGEGDLSTEDVLPPVHDVQIKVTGVNVKQVNETVVESSEDPMAQPEVLVSLPPHDAHAENTFDRLLEMGFEFNVVVSAIKENGPVLENCLQALLR